MLNSSFWWQ